MITFSGLRSRRSVIRYGSSGSGTGAGRNLYLVLNTRPRDLMAETRDLRTDKGSTRCCPYLETIEDYPI